MNKRCGTDDPSPRTKEEFISDMTLTVEFLLTAMRAVANGHSPDSKATQDPLGWARSKLDELRNVGTQP